MLYSLHIFIFTLFCLHIGFAKLTFETYPSSFNFKESSNIGVSSLSGILASTLGYSSEHQLPGLEIADFYSYPQDVVIVDVVNGGISLDLKGQTYELDESIDFSTAYNDLHETVSNSAQRKVSFQDIQLKNLGEADTDVRSKTDSLNANEIVDSEFLSQVYALQNVSKMMKHSSKNDQNILVVKFNAFENLVKKYGVNAPQVVEAKKLLADSISILDSRMRKNVKNTMIVVVSHQKILSRKPRQAPGPEPANMGGSHTRDFPAIFNIILILTIIMVVAVIAASVSIAFMDPGRDSIIYRMTNPRMKKDQ